MKPVKTLFLLLFVSCSLVAQGQENKNNGWLSKTIKRICQKVDELSIASVDTNYLSLPKHGWKVAVTTNFAGIDADVEGHNIPTYDNINVNMHSNMVGQTTVTMGYRSLSAGYSFNIAKGYSRDFNLSILTSRVGLEVRSHTTDRLHGTLDASATPQSLPVSEGDTRMRATLINGYYVFNHRHYSLPAAMKQSKIQKRSSGSVTAYALFLSANLKGKNPQLSHMLNGLKQIEFYQAAIGLGYGYNYTPNRGRLLFHASAAPLVVFFNKSFITADVAVPLADGTRYETEISKEVSAEHKFFLTGVARATVFYNINSHLFVGAAALINDIRLSTASGVQITTSDWVMNATLGIRL